MSRSQKLAEETSNDGDVVVVNAVADAVIVRVEHDRERVLLVIVRAGELGVVRPGREAGALLGDRDLGVGGGRSCGRGGEGDGGESGEGGCDEAGVLHEGGLLVSVRV